MALPSYDTISGIVSSVNPKGVKLEGQDTWSNFSKFAADLVPPMRGQSVTLTLDRQGFVRAITSTDGSEATMSAPSAQSAAQSAQQATSPFDSQARSGQARERTITRLAVLKAAAEFGAARPGIRSGEVLKIAASWERWVNRESSAEDELVDAF